MFKSQRCVSNGSPKSPIKSSPATIKTDDTPQHRLESPYATIEISTSIVGDNVQSTDSSDGGAHNNVESPGALSPSSPVQNESLYHLIVKHDARSCRTSLASNIFDDQDSQSAGIREYVESKISEAFHRHSCNCPVRAPLNVTAKFELDNSGGMPCSPPIQRIHLNTNLLHGPQRLGPIVLKYSFNTYNLQKGTVVIYLLTVSLSAIGGPKTFFVTIWRLSAALITYSVAVRLCGWHKNAQTDLFLAPVAYALALLHNFICDAFDQYSIFKVDINSQIMRESLAEVGVVLDPK